MSRLHGQKVVVVNSSYEVYPNADYLVFTDLRWWRQHHARVRASFKGQIVTVVPPASALYGDDVLTLERYRGAGLSTVPGHLVWWHTTLTSVNDLLRWLGAVRICYLGLDGADASDGRAWHHAPHPAMWGRNPSRYRYHGEALAAQVEPLRAAGVQVFNLNPDSTHLMFPFANLEEFLPC